MYVVTLQIWDKIIVLEQIYQDETVVSLNGRVSVAYYSYMLLVIDNVNYHL